jgi:hypothetical protein
VKDIITTENNDLMQFHKHPLNLACESGNISGRDAVPCMGTVLKRIIFSNLTAEKDII